jgi:hypothetical protein
MHSHSLGTLSRKGRGEKESPHDRRAPRRHPDSNFKQPGFFSQVSSLSLADFPPEFSVTLFVALPHKRAEPVFTPKRGSGAPSGA